MDWWDEDEFDFRRCGRGIIKSTQFVIWLLMGLFKVFQFSLKLLQVDIIKFLQVSLDVVQASLRLLRVCLDLIRAGLDIVSTLLNLVYIGINKSHAVLINNHDQMAAAASKFFKLILFIIRFLCILICLMVLLFCCTCFVC